LIRAVLEAHDDDAESTCKMMEKYLIDLPGRRVDGVGHEVHMQDDGEVPH